MMLVFFNIVALLLSVAYNIPFISAHGYLKSPRSRNLVAYQDKNWNSFLSGNGQTNDPKPEDCPHCLNRGGTLAQCGLLSGIVDNIPWERNYDQPLNAWGKPMKPNIQGTYTEGEMIEVEVMATTHHKGHFEFAICPIENKVPMEVPTQECFAKHKLKFIRDELYGAPQDVNYPERAYLAPAVKATWTNGENGEQPVVGAQYKLIFQLPYGVSGDVVLLQWYYLTANSCKHPGYELYPFPEAWGKDVLTYPALPDCEHVPEDGNGVPEQFWNCAEIEILKSDKPREDIVNEIDELDVGAKVDAEQNNIVETVVDNTPDTSEETAPAVIIPYEPCANPHSTYYEANADCTGYHVCMSGKPFHEFDCEHGMLYDETNLLCNYASEVNCVIKVEIDGETPKDEGVATIEAIPEESVPDTEIVPTRPVRPSPATIMTDEPTYNPTTARPTTRPTQKPINQSRKPTGRPTPRPSRKPSGRPTPRPSKRPTPKPTGRPVATLRPTNKPAISVVEIFNQDTQELNTKKPSRYPTPHPSPKPTPKPRRQRTPRPTPNPKPPSYSSSGSHPIASSYFANSPSFSIIPPPSKPERVPINKPSKGQESSVGNSISSQIQYHQENAQKEQKQKQKRKKRLQKKRQKMKLMREKKQKQKTRPND